MKIKVVKSKIDVLDYIYNKSYQVEIEGKLGGVVDLSEIEKELKRLFDRLEELENEIK